MNSRYVTMMSSFTMVAVFDRVTGDLEWVDQIRDDTHYERAYSTYPRWDMNRKRMIRDEQPSAEGSTSR